jgi:flagellar hook-length control protein FliK
LAGALAAVQAGTAAATAPPATAAASDGGTSSPDTGTIGTSGKSSTAGLDLLLTQNLTADGKAGGSNPAAADASSTAAASAASASTAAAAGLTAATQLSSAAHLASQQQGPAPSAMSLSSPVGTSAWTDELGTKVTWMAHQGIESASLQLSPEHLGPLQVNISVHDGQASVWFGAAQPDTRTALQQSLPHLRQLFASQGLSLADAGVSREPPRGQSQQQSARSAPSISGVASVSLERVDTRVSSIGGLGLLDTYA